MMILYTPAKRGILLLIVSLSALGIMACGKRGSTSQSPAPAAESAQTETTAPAPAAEITTAAIEITLADNTMEQSSMDFSKLFPASETFDSVSEKVCTIRSPDPKINIPQGGCINGAYQYQAFIRKDTESSEANNIVRIVKSELAAGQTVKESQDLSLNHANDITYNPGLNALAVVHNKPNRTHVSLIDADTLEPIRTVELPCEIYCISYNEKRNQYVVGLSGGQSFTILDSDFRMVQDQPKQPTPRTEGYVTQGMTSDDTYIYFVLYKESVITVYDWEGQFVTLIELNVENLEPENISVMGGQLYVSAASGWGAAVYRITPTAKE